MNQGRLFPLSGVAFVGLVLALVGLSGSAPGTDEPATEVVSFYAARELREFLGVFAFAATVPFLLLFAVGLARAGDGPGAGRSPWGHVTIAGATLAAGAILVASVIHFALLDAATGEDVPPAAVSALNAVDGSTWVGFNAGFGVMMLGAAGLFLSAAGPRWLGWVALVLGVALFVPYADFVALLAMLVWIPVAGVLVARGETGRAYVTAPGAA
jgi:hypothetical protein